MLGGIIPMFTCALLRDKYYPLLDEWWILMYLQMYFIATSRQHGLLNFKGMATRLGRDEWWGKRRGGRTFLEILTDTLHSDLNKTFVSRFGNPRILSCFLIGKCIPILDNMGWSPPSPSPHTLSFLFLMILQLGAMIYFLSLLQSE